MFFVCAVYTKMQGRYLQSVYRDNYYVLCLTMFTLFILFHKLLVLVYKLLIFCRHHREYTSFIALSAILVNLSHCYDGLSYRSSTWTTINEFILKSSLVYTMVLFTACFVLIYTTCARCETRIVHQGNVHKRDFATF